MPTNQQQNPQNWGQRLVDLHNRRLEQGYRVSGYEVPRQMTRDDWEPYWIREQRQQFTPSQDQEQTIQQMPNYNKLTPLEHWIYGKLPGFSESTVGRALTKFGESWAGKALSYLDIGAEAVERTSGLVAQYKQAVDTNTTDEFFDNFKSAWYAGSLFADTLNLPVFRRGEDGKINGIALPTDLPGTKALVEARQKIADGVPLEQVRAEYYEGLGALQLRGQMYDTYFHVLADPLNYIMPALKPVERIQAARYAAVAGTKITEQGLDVLRVAEAAARAENRLDDAAGFAARIADSKLLTRTDRLIIAITGGDPLTVPTSKLGTALRSKWNPLALTPAARAHELVAMTADHVSNYLLSRFDDPIEMVSALRRAATSVLGEEFGHAFLNLEGRTAQSMLGGFDTKAQELLSRYMGTQPQREALYGLAQAIEENPDRLLGQLVDAVKNKDEAFLKTISTRGNVGVDVLKKIGAVFEDTPHNPALFKMYLTNSFADHAAQLGVTMFGVTQRGFLEKASIALKSAETLAFLRANPGYAIRNLVNNEFTMLARGLVKRMTGASIDDLWTRIGFDPLRLSQGIGAAGVDVQRVVSKATSFAEKPAGEIAGKAIYEALRGERGAFDKFADALNGLKLGKLDASVFASRMEVSASRRAMSLGFLEGMRKYYWKPGSGFDLLSDALTPQTRAAIEAIDPGFIRGVEDSLASALHVNEIDDLLKGDIQLSIRGIVDDASSRAGFDVAGVLQEDFIAKHEAGLLEAARSGKTALNDFMKTVRRDIEENLDDWIKVDTLNKAAEVEARITAEGIHALPLQMADEVDTLWEFHLAHASEMERLTSRFTSMSPDALNVFWDNVKAQSDGHFNRMWESFEASLRGVKAGAAKKGMEIPDDVLEGFSIIRGKTKEFYGLRNRLQSEFFTARAAKQPPPLSWGEIQNQLDARYGELIDIYDSTMAHVDGVISDSMPAQMRDSFRAWRRDARALRREDMEEVVKFRLEVAKETDHTVREKMWQSFWADRRQRFTTLRETDRRGFTALGGNSSSVDDLSAFNEHFSSFSDIPEILNRGVDPATSGDPGFARIREFIEEFGTQNDRLVLGSNVQSVNVHRGMLGGGEQAAQAAIQDLLDHVGKVYQRVSGDFRTLRGEPLGLTIAEQVEAIPDQVGKINKLASLYGVPTVTDTGIQLDQRVVDTINKALRGAYEPRKPFDPAGLSRAELEDILSRFDYTPQEIERMSIERMRTSVSKIENPEPALIEGAAKYTLEQYRAGQIPLDIAEESFKKRAEFYKIDVPPTGVGGRPGTAASEAQARLNKLRNGSLTYDEWKPKVDRLDQEFSTRPINDINRGVADAMLQELDRLQADLEAAFEQKGMLFWEENKVVGGQKSGLTKLEWYQKLSQYSQAKKPAPPSVKTLMEAMKKIKAGQGLDRGKWVERVKLLLLERIQDTDARYMLAIGNERAAYEVLAKEVDGLGDDWFDLIRAKYGDDTDNLLEFLNKDPATLREYAKPSGWGNQWGVPDYHALQAKTEPIGIGTQEYWTTRAYKALDALEESALEAGRRRPLKLADLPAEAQAEIEKYITRTKGQMSDARNASNRFAQFRRDAALLNYNRRVNFNTWLGTISPFEFWTTGSIFKWALHSIDRPAMLSTFLRMRKMLSTTGAPNQELPGRLRGKLRFQLPFLPDYLGNEVFLDPLKIALPIDNFMFGYEEKQREQSTAAGRATRLLQEQMAKGVVDLAEAQQAIETKEGSLWENAIASVYNDDSELKFDTWDLFSALTPPHAPLVWAKEAYIDKTPENISPFSPLTRTSRAVSALLGDVSPLAGGIAGIPYTLEAKIRKSLGLPAYDKWDDYRVERMISNMIAAGDLTPDEGMRSIVEHDASGETDEVWQLAAGRAEKEFAIGGLSGSLGIPLMSYPPGEREARSLADDFGRAYEAYKGGNVQALTSFFDEHPEYEARLALFKKPEERLKSYLIDQLWSQYNSFPTLNKNELRDQLGNTFYESFLSKDTRSYESISIEDLQTWIKIAGGDPPGTLSKSVDRAKLTDPDTAWRAQVFYDTRRRLYPDYNDLQSAYFEIQKGSARKKFLRDNPQLVEYWDFRRDWFHRNPDVVPFLDDDYEFQYPSAEARASAYANQPNFNWDEVRGMLPLDAQTLYQYYSRTGYMYPELRSALEELGDQFGVDSDFLINQFSSP